MWFVALVLQKCQELPLSISIIDFLINDWHENNVKSNAIGLTLTKVDDLLLWRDVMPFTTAVHKWVKWF